jgi:tRNA-specific 2-thiouridylase
LLKAADTAKDQSYFLHGVAPPALKRTMFPLGGLAKGDVRQMAHAAGLPVHDKPDSTGICFIGERPFEEFLSRHLHPRPGSIETDRGEAIGEHRGLAYYTLGQRAGLRLGGRAGARPAPWYVADKDIARNVLVVVQDQDHPLLLSAAFEVAELTWLGEPPAPFTEFSCCVKTRYRQRDLECRVRMRADGHAHVTLQESARAVTPGQYAVFYAGDLCLGGGVIATRIAFNRTPAAREIEYN